MIVEMHGAVDRAVEAPMSRRNLVDRTAMIEELSSLRLELVDVPAALSGRGVALTIDDATQAAAEAARIIAQAGCPVTLFVNPYNVETQSSYHFACLNSLCDSLITKEPTRSYEEVEMLRLDAKLELKCKRSERERYDFLQRLGLRFDVDDLTPAKHLQTLSTAELRELEAHGVVIANHGWTHCDYSHLNDQAYLRQVEMGADWLRENGFSGPDLFAVPYGRAIPATGNGLKLLGLPLIMSMKGVYPGWIGDQIYNRRSLDSLPDRRGGLQELLLEFLEAETLRGE